MQADVDGKRLRRSHRRTSVRRWGMQQRHSLDRCCRRWCKICRTFQNLSVNIMVRPCRDGMPGTLSPEVEAQDDTGIAETPQRLDGGSDGGYGRVCGQAFGHDGSSFAARKRAALRERGIAEQGRGCRRAVHQSGSGGSEHEEIRYRGPGCRPYPADESLGEKRGQRGIRGHPGRFSERGHGDGHRVR